MSDQRKPPLCDTPPWNHIRHRCCCVFDHDSDKDGPIAECYYHERLRAERDELLETQRKFGSMMHEQMDKLDEAVALLREIAGHRAAVQFFAPHLAGSWLCLPASTPSSP